MASQPAPDEEPTSQVELHRKPTRVETLTTDGIPAEEEYAHVLLNDDYMHTFVRATQKAAAKRRLAMGRYVMMNKIVLAALVIQAFVFCFIAIYKTFLVPSFTFSMNVGLEDVDMVLMLDASGHLAEDADVQQVAAGTFSNMLRDAMDHLTYHTRVSASKMVRDSRQEKNGWLSWERSTDVHNDQDPSQPFDSGVSIDGGRLRLATGLFNAYSTRALHDLTFAAHTQAQHLENATRAEYKGYAPWYDAMATCSDVFSAKGQRDFQKYRGAFPRRALRCHRPEKVEGQECHDAKTLDACSDMPFCDWVASGADSDGSEGAGACVEKRHLCRKQFCVIIGDSDALCKKRGLEDEQWAQAGADVCARKPDLCMPDGEVKRLGVPVEWSVELGECEAKAADMLWDPRDDADFEMLPYAEKETRLNEKDDIKVIMMLTVQSDTQKQLRLSSQRFRQFVTETTGCRIVPTDDTYVHPVTGLKTTYTLWTLDEATCTRFIMETDRDVIASKSKRIKDLLESDVQGGGSPNPDQDARYLICLLGVLPLAFYFGWAKLVQWYSQAKMQARRAFGVKKRMIKVTKTVVEKEPQSPCPSDAGGGCRDIELAEIQSRKMPIVFNSKLTLRARFHGGNLRSNDTDSVADGRGRAYDQCATWYAEPVGDTLGGKVGDSLQAQQPFRLRNHEGKFLCVDQAGSGFSVDDGDGAACGSVFVAEAVAEGSDDLHVGANIRLKCLETEQYLRVDKDGVCNAAGCSSQPDTQFQIDVGGQPLTDGATIVLRSDAAGEFVHGIPSGGVRIGEYECEGYNGKEWRPWVIECVGDRIPDREANAAQEAQQALGARVVQEGDVVRLRALNQGLLEAAEDGHMSCGSDALSASTRAGVREFVVQRLGGAVASKQSRVLRCGAQITLRPSPSDASCRTLGFVRYDGDVGEGRLVADGAADSQDIGFTIDPVHVQRVVAPLGAALRGGDVDVAFSPLWNKNEVQHVAAVSSPWTDDETLNDIKGLVVVATDAGAYSVPKGGADWVAVVKDGLNLAKAAEQAKSQGATGLIVRCAEAFSADRIALGGGDEEVPCLPVVFVDDDRSGGLCEKGVVLKGCEFQKKHVTRVMRALGDIGTAATPEKRLAANLRVFQAAGAAMKVRAQAEADEKAAEKERAEQAALEATYDEEEGPGRFKWQVKANTHYYWARGGGAATKMQVNFGRAVPPSARMGTGTDPQGARSFRRLRSMRSMLPGGPAGVSSRGQGRKSTLRRMFSVAHVPAEDASVQKQLSDLLTLEQAAEQPLEELPAESDFRIEYKFEEVEVGADETAQDLDARAEEAEFLANEGAVIKAVGVPRSQFWIVAVGLVVFTLCIFWILWAVMSRRSVPAPQADAYADAYDDTSGSPGPGMSAAFAARHHFLAAAGRGSPARSFIAGVTD